MTGHNPFLTFMTDQIKSFLFYISSLISSIIENTTPYFSSFHNSSHGNIFTSKTTALIHVDFVHSTLATGAVIGQNFSQNVLLLVNFVWHINFIGWFAFQL